jgi:lysophospholipase L1-like esterase
MQRLIVIGDSIVLGHWDSAGGWLAAIRSTADAFVIQSQRDHYAVVYNLGVGSDTSVQVLDRYPAEVRARKYGYPAELFIVIGVGINDSLYEVGAEKCLVDLDDYDHNMRELLKLAKADAEHRVIMLGLTPVNEMLTTPVPWKKSPSEYRNELVAEYNTRAKRAALDTGARFVDLYSHLSVRSEELHHSWDGVHPNAISHGLIAQLVGQELAELGWGPRRLPSH